MIKEKHENKLRIILNSTLEILVQFSRFHRPAVEEEAPKTEDSVTQNIVQRIPNLERVTLPFYEFPASKTTIFKGIVLDLLVKSLANINYLI